MHIGTTNTSFQNLTSGPYSVTSLFSAISTDISTYSPVAPPHLSEKQKSLLWVLSTVLGVFCFLAGVAFILFYTIRRCEIITMRICYKYFGCCPPVAKSSQYRELGEQDQKDEESDTLYLRELRDRAFDPDKYMDEKYH